MAPKKRHPTRDNHPRSYSDYGSVVLMVKIRHGHYLYLGVGHNQGMDSLSCAISMGGLEHNPCPGKIIQRSSPCQRRGQLPCCIVETERFLSYRSLYNLNSHLRIYPQSAVEPRQRRTFTPSICLRSMSDKHGGVVELKGTARQLKPPGDFSMIRYHLPRKRSVRSSQYISAVHNLHNNIIHTTIAIDNGVRRRRAPRPKWSF